MAITVDGTSGSAIIIDGQTYEESELEQDVVASFYGGKCQYLHLAAFHLWNSRTKMYTFNDDGLVATKPSNSPENMYYDFANEWPGDVEYIDYLNNPGSFVQSLRMPHGDANRKGGSDETWMYGRPWAAHELWALFRKDFLLAWFSPGVDPRATPLEEQNLGDSEEVDRAIKFLDKIETLGNPSYRHTTTFLTKVQDESRRNGKEYVKDSDPQERRRLLAIVDKAFLENRRNEAIFDAVTRAYRRMVSPPPQLAPQQWYDQDGDLNAHGALIHSFSGCSASTPDEVCARKFAEAREERGGSTAPFEDDPAELVDSDTILAHAAIAGRHSPGDAIDWSVAAESVTAAFGRKWPLAFAPYGIIGFIQDLKELKLEACEIASLGLEQLDAGKPHTVREILKDGLLIGLPSRIMAEWMEDHMRASPDIFTEVEAGWTFTEEEENAPERPSAFDQVTRAYRYLSPSPSDDVVSDFLENVYLTDEKLLALAFGGCPLVFENPLTIRNQIVRAVRDMTVQREASGAMPLPVDASVPLPTKDTIVYHALIAGRRFRRDAFDWDRATQSLTRAFSPRWPLVFRENGIAEFVDKMNCTSLRATEVATTCLNNLAAGGERHSTFDLLTRGLRLREASASFVEWLRTGMLKHPERFVGEEDDTGTLLWEFCDEEDYQTSDDEEEEQARNEVEKEVPRLFEGDFDENPSQVFATRPSAVGPADYAKMGRIEDVDYPGTVFYWQKQGLDRFKKLQDEKCGEIDISWVGTGKTIKAMLKAMWCMKKAPEGSKRALVLCPAAVFTSWTNEVEKVFGADSVAEFKETLSKFSHNDLLRIQQPRVKFVLMSIQATEATFANVLPRVQDSVCCVIYDEAHILRGENRPKAQREDEPYDEGPRQVFYKLSRHVLDRGGGIVVNTATPVVNAIQDFVVLCRLAGVPNALSHTPAFWKNLKSLDRNERSAIEVAMDTIAVNRVSFVIGIGGYTREGLLEIPEAKEDIIKEYAMDSETLDRYVTILNSPHANISSLHNCETHPVLSYPFSQRTDPAFKRMWDAAKEHFKHGEKTIPSTSSRFDGMRAKAAHALEKNNKTKAFANVVKEYVDRGEKVVVFAQQIPTVDYLALVVAEFTTVLAVHSSVSASVKNTAEKRFKSTGADAVQVLVLGLDYGNAGINLQVSHVTIFFNVSTTEVIDEQARGRTYRFGQLRPCEFIMFQPVVTDPSRINTIQSSKKRFPDIDTSIKNTLWRRKKWAIEAFKPSNIAEATGDDSQPDEKTSVAAVKAYYAPPEPQATGQSSVAFADTAAAYSA